jgi:hypothetical protein
VKKNLLIIISSILMQHDLQAQARAVVENYLSISKAEPVMWMPILSRTGRKGLHTELRYNYEERRTGSIYIGQQFRRDSTFSFAVTPMLGWVFGRYNGGSLGLNGDADYKGAYISFQSQYTVSKAGRDGNFFYMWGEIGYDATDWLYAGISSQVTSPYKERTLAEYGILVGFKIRKITVPFYLFSPFDNKINFLIGLSLEL